jgi:hypothetical protein
MLRYGQRKRIYLNIFLNILSTFPSLPDPLSKQVYFISAKYFLFGEGKNI